MGLFQCSSSAREFLSAVDQMVEMPLTSICFEGPADRLTDTAYAQPGVVAVSLAAAAALEERMESAGLSVVPAQCAGHSVGELAALGYSGALSAEDCLKLVAVRGRLMAEASALAGGSMIAVIGLDEGSLDGICPRASEETGAWVQIANLNSPGQVVLSGDRRALDRVSELARERGARRVVPLDVSGPFHSVYMQPAADRFREAVMGASIIAPSTPVVLNATAQPCTEPQLIAEELVVQMTSPVRWTQSVQSMRDAGCTVFVELGPGQVLSGLIKRIVKDVTVLNVEDEESLDAAVAGLLRLL